MSPNTSLALPPGKSTVRVGLRSGAGHGRAILRDFLALFDNNRAESVPLIAWALWLPLMRVVHSAAEQPVEYACIFVALAVVPAVAFWFELTSKPRGGVLFVELVAVAIFLWSAFAVGMGLNGKILLCWVVILAAMYVPLFLEIVQAKHTKAQKIVWEAPPAAAAPPVDEFEGINWLKGARWEGPERVTATGSARRLIVPPGVSTREFATKYRDGMANHLTVNPDAIELDDPGLGYAVDVYRHDRVDLHAEPLAWPWADREVMNSSEPIPLGPMRNGEVATLLVDEGHTLVGGTTGSGKSVAVAIPTIAYALDPEVDLYCIDPKLADMAMFEHACRMYVRNDYDAGLKLLKTVADEIPRRGAICAEYGVRKVQDLPRDAGGGRMLPKIRIVIDELAHFTIDAPDEIRDEACRLLGIVLKQGRAADVLLLAATQRPDARTVPTDMRAQFKYGIALRTRERSTTKMILGDGAKVDCSTIPTSRPGVGYLADDLGVRLVRTFYLPDREVYRLAKLAPPALRLAPSDVIDQEPVYLDAPRQAITAKTPEGWPSGRPAPAGWHVQLWDELGPEYRSTKDLAEAVGKTLKPVRELLRKWADGAYAPVEVAKDGAAELWRRPS